MNKYVGLIALAAVLLGTQPASAQDGDFQTWFDISVAGDLNDTWRVKVNQEYKWQDDSTEHFENHTDIGFSRYLADWFIFGLNYRRQYNNKKGEWFAEDRFHINGTVKWKWADVPLLNRARLEYRSREAADDFFRFRDILTVSYPEKFTSYDVQPYVADEIFIDSDHGEFNANRFYVGLKAKPTDSVATKLYYVLLSTDSEDWIHRHVAALTVALSF